MSEITGIVIYEPELRFTMSGHELCTFEIDTGTEKIRCVAWRDVAESIIDRNWLPGNEVTVSGTWKTRIWNQGGETRTTREYIVKLFVGPANAGRI
jgi:single-stranded DNA-binding protein